MRLEIPEAISGVTFSGLIGHFLGRRLANIYGKKPMFIIGSLAACICILMMGFCFPEGNDEKKDTHRW